MKKFSFLLLVVVFVGCGGGGGGGETSGSGSGPVVMSLAASSITPTSAILNGTVIPNGLQTQSWFEYGTDSTLTIHTTSPKQDAGNGLSSQAASMTWNGLAPGTTYYFRFCAENSKGISNGIIISFTTSSSGNPPTVATLPASSVGASGATLNSNVSPNGLATTAWFEWGTDPTLISSTSTSSQSVGSGTTSQPVNAALTGLSTGTTYYYRVAASNSSGTSKGSILSFIPGAAPAVTTLAATSVGTTTATLNGNVTPNGLATTAWFEWGTDHSMTTYSNTTTQSLGSGVISQVASAQLIGLSSGTTYYFRVAASNVSGTVRGLVLSFTSATPPPPAPTGVAATAGPGEATIDWAEVTGATSYNIYYSTTPGVTKTTGTKVAGVTSPEIVTPLTYGTTWYFVVTAENAGGESVNSSEVSAVPTLPPPPPAPTDVTATAGAGEATINWAAVTGATSYNIYYSTTPGVNKTTGTKVAGVTSPETVTPLTYGTIWYFVVTAENAGGESADSSQVSAIPFVEYVAFGDSITFGDEDDLPADDTSIDGRNTGGGFEPVLNNLLTSATGIAHSIVNEGYGGYNSSNGLGVLTTTVLGNHPNATYYLILFGTNDANPNNPNPVQSGLGLNPGDSGYSGSYKENMQRMIDAIETAGKIPYLAKVPYTLDAARTAAILEYNQVIDELVVANGIPVTPPDFYGWFQANQGQLADSLHPNGAGYQSMANLWFNALVP